MAPTTRLLLPLSGDKKAVKRTVAHFGSFLPSLSPTLVFPTPRKRPGRDSLHTEGWILREQLRATCVINTAISTTVEELEPHFRLHHSKQMNPHGQQSELFSPHLTCLLTKLMCLLLGAHPQILFWKEAEKQIHQIMRGYGLSSRWSY